MHSLTLEELSACAMALPSAQRAVLAERLAGSLEDTKDRLSPAWAEEVIRRRDEMRSGKVKGIPGEEVFALARREAAARR